MRWTQIVVLDFYCILMTKKEYIAFLENKTTREIFPSRLTFVFVLPEYLQMPRASVLPLSL